MDFLKSFLLSEARMKDAAMDLVYQAKEQVPNKGDDRTYTMKLVAKVLELDKNKLFKGDAIQAEKMIKQVLGEEVVSEGDVIPFPGKKKAAPAAKVVAKKTALKAPAAPQGVTDKVKAKAYPLTSKGLYQLLGDLDEDAAEGVQDYLDHDCRYKDLDVDWNGKVVRWVTQQSSDGQSQDAARMIARTMKKAGFPGFLVKVVVRDDWGDDDKKTPWKKAKS